MGGITPIPSKAPAWLANWIGRTDERLDNMEQALPKMDGKLDQVLARLPAASSGNPGPKENSSPKTNGITHKWLSEKVLVPVLLAVNSAILAIVLAHLLGV